MKLIVPFFLLLGASALFAQSNFPVTVKDASGFSLTVPVAPRAIVSLTLATDELLLDLVDPSRLKAIDTFAADPGISNIAAWARTFPTRITGDKEAVLALKPDLVLVADWKDKEFVQTLRDAGVPVFVCRTANNFDELTAAITALSSLVGAPEKGRQLVARIQTRLAAVTDRIKNLTPDQRPSVLFYSFSGSTYGKGTSADALVTAAGLVNAAARAGLSGWPTLSREQLLQLNPDIIVLPSWNYGGKTDTAVERRQFVADPALAGLRAIRTNRVLVLDDRHLNATSQYMADGVEDLARAAWPELFGTKP
jgi:iron complex transport system substrate-binding protein